MGINSAGQVAGTSALLGDLLFHAFRTAANSPINPATDDLGTLGGTISQAKALTVRATWSAFPTRPATLPNTPSFITG